MFGTIPMRRVSFYLRTRNSLIPNPKPPAPFSVLFGNPFLRAPQAEPNATLQGVRVALEQEVRGARRQHIVRKDVQLA